MGRVARDAGVEAYREVLSDGLLDIFIGMLVFVMIGYASLGGTAAAETPLVGEALLLLAVIALVAAFEFARRRVTYRRVPHPDETGDLARRQSIVMFTLLITLVAGAGLPFVLAWVPRLAGTYFVPVLLAGVVTLVTGVMALTFALPRFWAYAVLFGLPLLLQRALGPTGLPDNLALYFGTSALAAIIIGMTLLTRFVRRHPLPPGGEHPTRAAHA